MKRILSAAVASAMRHSAAAPALAADFTKDKRPAKISVDMQARDDASQERCSNRIPFYASPGQKTLRHGHDDKGTSRAPICGERHSESSGEEKAVGF